MFVNLAFALKNGGQPTAVDAMDLVLTQLTTEQIAYYLERLWERPRPNSRNVLPGGSVQDLQQQQNQAFDVHRIIRGDRLPVPSGNGYWRHIVYAYMLESTNMLAVFQRVLFEWLHGEELPFPTLGTQMWLRTTEQLFFTTPQPPSIRSLMSDIRPNRGDIRCNAYFRLLGLDLPSGSRDGRPYVKADVANREFVVAWEQLLRDTWRAYSNVKNQSGPNETDKQALEELVRQIREMLTARRSGGALSREEFDAVTFFSWFHLVILGDTEIVKNLTAQSTSPALRLKKIADQVSVPIQSKSDSFIQLADDMADILETIETGALEATPADIERLYDETAPSSLARTMVRVMTHWTITTGHDVKGARVHTTIVKQAPAVQAPTTAIPLPQTSRFQTVTR